MERFGIDKAEAGSLFLLMTLGILAGSLVFGPLVDRYGYKGILLAATALVAISLEGIAFATSMTGLRFAIVAIGFGGGIINGANNALVADISSEERAASLNLLGVSFGVGAVGVPFALSVLTNRYTQSSLVAGVGVLVLLVVIFIALPTFPAPKQPQGFPIADAGRLVRDRVILLIALMLFLESGIEITVGGWTSTFVTEELDVPPRHALMILSLYWMGMMLARLALGYILRRTSPFRALYVCLASAVAGSGLLLTTSSVSVAAVGVFLLGVGFRGDVSNAALIHRRPLFGPLRHRIQSRDRDSTVRRHAASLHRGNSWNARMECGALLPSFPQRCSFWLDCSEFCRAGCANLHQTHDTQQTMALGNASDSG